MYFLLVILCTYSWCVYVHSIFCHRDMWCVSVRVCTGFFFLFRALAHSKRLNTIWKKKRPTIHHTQFGRCKCVTTNQNGSTNSIEIRKLQATKKKYNDSKKSNRNCENHLKNWTNATVIAIAISTLISDKNVCTSNCARQARYRALTTLM